MKRSLLWTFVGLAVLVALLAWLAVSMTRGTQIAAVTNFDECKAAGYPVQESYPEQCRTPDGRTFVNKAATSTPPGNGGNVATSTGGGTTNPMIQVESLSANQSVKSPLTITGKARGNWYFEASFPVELRDANGKMLAQVPAQAEGEWMTTEFVPFKATLTFAQPTTATGVLIFRKDNPSGLPENDAEIRLPVRFAASAGGAQAGCYIGGCSGQICSDEKDAASTCEFRPEYACYKESYAKCERQANGQCGWTPNSQLSSCLANPPALE